MMILGIFIFVVAIIVEVGILDAMQFLRLGMEFGGLEMMMKSVDFSCFCTYMVWCVVCIIAGRALSGMVYRSILVSWEGLVTEISLFLCDFLGWALELEDMVESGIQMKQLLVIT
jgi:hypothetical protein